MPTFVFSLFFILFFGIVAYTWVKGIRAFSLEGNHKLIYNIVSTIMLASLFAAMILAHLLPATLGKVISTVGYSYLIILVYMLFAFLATDLLLLVNRLAHFIPDVKLFRIVIGYVALATIMVVMFVGNYRFYHPNTVSLNLRTHKTQQEKTMKIVAVSDLHLGVLIDKKLLSDYVARINSEKPDLVLIGGDLIDRSLRPVVSQRMDEELRRLKAPLGVYAVYGNHEHFSESLADVEAFYQKSNINLLRDSSVLVDNSVLLVGRDDRMNPERKSLNAVINGADHSRPIILLDHQPVKLDEAVSNGVDIQFSGHTHNGQFFPGNLIVDGIFENGYGYLKKANTHFYTSSGLGIWGPLYRIGTQSELVVINFNY